MSKPLVSLTVICYQAEKFVQEAIEGAFAQTYSPLEIIFSDDASTDNTFSIIEDAVKKYSGPHRIVLNRNPVNMGIGAHVSKVWFDIAQGDWIIVSAGDDVSLPHRVERLMEVARPEIGAIHHGCIPIDERSQELTISVIDAKIVDEASRKPVEELIKEGHCLLGSTMCLNKKMLNKYGHINADVVNEDNVLIYRAQDFGGIIYLDEPLMLYRIHKESVTNQFNDISVSNYSNRIIKNSKTRLAIIRQVFDDAKIISLSPSLINELESEKKKLEMDLFLFADGKFNPKFITDSWFYIKTLKRIFFRPYWYLLKSRQQPNLPSE